MKPLPPSPEDKRTSAPAGALRRLAGRFFPGYRPTGAVLLMTIMAGGTAAVVWAIVQCVGAPPGLVLKCVAALLLVGLVAAFPVRIAGTNYSISAADVFVFATLLELGPAAAILAAAVEGVVGSLRAKRGPRMRAILSMTPLLATTQVATVATYGAGTVLGGRAGLGAGATMLAALCAAAAVNALGTIFLTTWITRHRYAGQAAWSSSFTAAGLSLAVMLPSAMLAGVLYLGAAHAGADTLLVTCGAAAGLALLLRFTLARMQAERVAQEAQIAAAQHDAALSQKRFSVAFTHAAIGMLMVQPGGKVLQVNRAVTALLGLSEAEILAQPFRRLLHPGDAELFLHQTEEVLAQRVPAFSMELRCHRGDGEDRWMSVHCSPCEDPAGGGPCLIHQMQDITPRHEAEDRLQRIAYHDTLTDLANRHCFEERLKLAVENSRLDSGERFAILYLDLDRFKVVNDSLGHIAGDRLLREVAQRVLQCVRPSDLVARLGGDEFAVLLEALHDRDDAQRLAARLQAALAPPVLIDGAVVLAPASIGLTFSDLGYRTADEVLRDADLAMYEAKAAGRNRVVVFDQSMHDRMTDRLGLEADLRQAIATGQLSLHFQPVFALPQQRLVGFEALARWQHPQRGPVSPAVFVVMAEETGQVEALTDWAIEQAVAQLAAWRAAVPQADAIGVSVNLSGMDLARADLAPRVQAVLQRHGVPAARLTLEITETALMSRLDTALATLVPLREIGVHLSIDDFGTGYSSLAYLSTLPIDSLKVDRSFVMGLHDKPENTEIVRAVLTLAQSLGRQVVAEGIESAEQLALLCALGARLGQGYLLSRPLPAAQAGLLITQTTVPVPAART